MHLFISCDWGTSSFRLRLVDPISHAVLAQVKSLQGIADAYDRWRQQSRDESERFSFYQSIIGDHLRQLQEQVIDSLDYLPIIVSGMASSNIGMVELGYKELPLAIDGSDLVYKSVGPTEYFPHEVIVISGAKTTNDVMRGEEIQLIGCDFPSGGERIYIFPGTHSKHITVKDQRVIHFKTFMTGEFFHLLSQQSILSKSVEDDHLPWSSETQKSFEEGVEQSLHGNLLHEAFLVRTNHLFGDFTKAMNYHYLSGLLIGTELKGLANRNVPLTVVANEIMLLYYVTALQKLKCFTFEKVDVDISLVKGHCKVYLMLRHNIS